MDPMAYEMDSDKSSDDYWFMFESRTFQQHLAEWMHAAQTATAQPPQYLDQGDGRHFSCYLIEMSEPTIHHGFENSLKKTPKSIG